MIDSGSREFGLVHDEYVDDVEKFGRERPGGSGVEDGACASSFRFFESEGYCRFRHLEGCEHAVVRPEGGGLSVETNVAVGSLHDDDRILAVVAHLDECGSGRSPDLTDSRDVDTLVSQEIQESLAIAVAANRAQ